MVIIIMIHVHGKAIYIIMHVMTMERGSPKVSTPPIFVDSYGCYLVCCRISFCIVNLRVLVNLIYFVFM